MKNDKPQLKKVQSNKMNLHIQCTFFIFLFMDSPFSDGLPARQIDSYQKSFKYMQYMQHKSDGTKTTTITKTDN